MTTTISKVLYVKLVDNAMKIEDFVAKLGDHFPQILSVDQKLVCELIEGHLLKVNAKFCGIRLPCSRETTGHLYFLDDLFDAARAAVETVLTASLDDFDLKFGELRDLASSGRQLLISLKIGVHNLASASQSCSSRDIEVLHLYEKKLDEFLGQQPDRLQPLN